MATSTEEPQFIAKHALWTPEQQAAAEALPARIEELGLRQIRIGWGDQHGIVRGKSLTPKEFARALQSGKDFQTATLIFDTTNNPAVPPFGKNGFGVEEMTGLPDGVLVPDPLTFKVLPWADATGWILCDLHFQSGAPVPFCTRGLLRRQLDGLAERGYGLKCGLEIEFYVTKLVDPMLEPEQCSYPPDPPKVKAIAHGFQYLTDNHADEVEGITRILQDAVEELGLPLATVEDEWGPGQCEFTFDVMDGLEAADTVLLFRSAVKQICKRHGYHATFMARPGLPNFFASGWHLHQSLVEIDDGANAFADPLGESVLSPIGMEFLAGILDHAAAASVFTTPTINGYKRFRPNSFAPSKIGWAQENRGAMIRVIGQPGDPGAHLENRVGEPTANPYLFLASQVVSGLDGIDRGLTPPPASEEAYEDDRAPLPASLMDAMAALREDPLFATAFGQPFVDYLLTVKGSEVSRFLQSVTDWEHREYFEMY
ncbi:MAG: glutamine synthetase family protein [Solirubrobacteraceae bacterium]|nr:glutamine synthetase family protein [Patulibacter sp.]